MTPVLVLNTGSSSLKWTVLTADGEVLAGENEPWAPPGGPSWADQIRQKLKHAPTFGVVGHRVVHGGTRFHDAVLIDAKVRRELGELLELAPDHMLAALGGVDAVSAAFPGIPQVAAFDTAFHQSIPEAAATYALPHEWTEQWGLRRFGFHGLSVSYAVERTRALLGATPPRLVVCHLGSGCSVTAVENGRSIDTTMGFTPLEGLMMATRSGSIDPGVLLHLQERCGIGVEELRQTLTTRSGLRGVSGVSGDLRAVLRAGAEGSARARLAYECFLLSARRAVGSMLAVLGGVDGVVFTGGIGENSARVRRDIATGFGFAGIEIARDDRELTGDLADISAPGSRARVLAIQAREDLAILREVSRVAGAWRK